MKNEPIANTENDESIARALAEQEEQAGRLLQPQVFEYPGDIRRRKQELDPSTGLCPGGCGPLQVRIATSGVVCNACNRVMENDELDHACPLCDYHECEFCRIRGSNPPRGTVVRGRNIPTHHSPPAATVPASELPQPQPLPQPFFGVRRRAPMCQIPCVVGPNSVCVEM